MSTGQLRSDSRPTGSQSRQPLTAGSRDLPGQGSCGVPGEVDHGGFDGFDPPPLRKATLISSCVTGRGTSHLGKAPDVTIALAVIEDVEEPAIEHGIELHTEINEAKGICDDEARLYAPVGRLRLGQLDGPNRHVNPTASRPHKGVLAGTTTDIEHPADQFPGRGQVLESWLGSPDVPRWGADRVDGIEVVGWTGWAALGKR
jgi:hypothetical protein